MLVITESVANFAEVIFASRIFEDIIAPSFNLDVVIFESKILEVIMELSATFEDVIAPSRILTEVTESVWSLFAETDASFNLDVLTEESYNWVVPTELVSKLFCVNNYQTVSFPAAFVVKTWYEVPGKTSYGRIVPGAILSLVIEFAAILSVVTAESCIVAVLTELTCIFSLLIQSSPSLEFIIVPFAIEAFVMLVGKILSSVI